MPSPKRLHLVRLLLACVLPPLCTGCEAVKRASLPRSPSATGTWTGRLASVTVRDNDGREYPAAALDIETGPRVLRGAGPELTVMVEPERDLVLLWRGRGIIDPDELNAPVGAKVRVSGRLSQGFPLKEFAPKGSTGGIMKHVQLVSEGERNNNLGIDIGGRGKPKVLKE